MNSLIQILSEERNLSWSVIGLVAICGGLLVRAVLLKGILRSMKIRNRSWYKRTLTHYQKRSIIGWIFFALFVLGIIFFWSFESYFLKRLNGFEWALVFVVLFFLSVLFHLRAYAQSIVQAVEEHVAADKDI